jgi:hypothetical protein
VSVFDALRIGRQVVDAGKAAAELVPAIVALVKQQPDERARRRLLDASLAAAEAEAEKLIFEGHARRPSR